MRQPPFAGEPYREWQQKGATLSHNTAEKEYGLTWDEIVTAIRAGKLQYRNAAMHGNPFLRLLRREVEALVGEETGDGQVRDRRLEAQLATLDRGIRTHQREIAALERKITALEREKARLLEGSDGAA